MTPLATEEVEILRALAAELEAEGRPMMHAALRRAVGLAIAWGKLPDVITNPPPPPRYDW